MSVALLPACLGCATRATARELPEGFPASTASPLFSSVDPVDDTSSPLTLGKSSQESHDHHADHHDDAAAGAADDDEIQTAPEQLSDVYTCPMHPEVTAKAPGQCRICGMHLEKKE